MWRVFCQCPFQIEALSKVCSRNRKHEWHSLGLSAPGKKTWTDYLACSPSSQAGFGSSPGSNARSWHTSDTQVSSVGSPGTHCLGLAQPFTKLFLHVLIHLVVIHHQLLHLAIAVVLSIGVLSNSPHSKGSIYRNSSTGLGLGLIGLFVARMVWHIAMVALTWHYHGAKA